MISPVDTYHIIAKYYDGAYAAKQDLVDLPFYLDLATQSRGSVLEIACGTGRVLLPIARKGIEICGVDNSLPMLKILKEHFAREIRTFLSSSGWRRTSIAERLNSGSSSRNNTPLWAREISPGTGTDPPPASDTSLDV